jgi:hypothetical protein
MSHGSDQRLRSDEGMALVAAILVMLLLGVFALSVSVLADLESRLGLNQRAAQQALALAEAGLEHGRNMLRDAVTPGDFNALIASAATRQLGVPTTGIPLGSGRYWVRVDNDCAAPGGFVGAPAFVPVVVEDGAPGGAECLDTIDENQTAVLTAWSEVTDGSGRVIGRARLRAHYTIVTPWKHACYDQDGELCISDAVPGCNNNPCIDPSDPRHPNGPATGDLPIPSDIRCGTNGSPPYPEIPATDIPADVQASGAITSNAPCVIYPYYQWALRQAAPTRTWCPAILASGYGNNSTNVCIATPGTFGWDPTNPTCLGPTATPQKCHGMVFFGPGNSPSTLATGADVNFGTSGSSYAGCMGTQNDGSDGRSCYAAASPDSSVVVYIMGKVAITNNVEVNGTVVVHGNGVTGSGTNKDFGLTGTNRVTTRACNTPVPGTPLAATLAPYCGYPLAILAYNPNEVAPTTAVGQTIQLDLSNSTSLLSGLIYSGGTAEVRSLTVDGGLIAWDVNITNTASRITYNPIYGNAARPYGNPARPPGFKPPPGFEPTDESSGIVMYPATWVHCTYYANETGGPSPCS